MADAFLLCVAQFVTAFCLLGVAEAACPPTNPGDGSVIEYQPINETQYDMTYSEMGSGGHPLGFYSSTWYHNQQNRQNPCIKITAAQASQRWIDIKVETVPAARLCFKDQSANSDVCFQGRGTACRATPADDNVYIEFHCDAQCEEADVNFWYRLVLSPLPSVQDPEMWCSERPVQYPTDLVTLPSGQTLPTYTTPRPKGDTGVASRQSTSSLMLATILLLSVFSL